MAMTDIQRSPILRLPTEILDLVISHLTSESAKPSREYIGPETPRFRKDLKPTLTSLRASCSSFAALEEPKNALFHHIILFTSQRSLKLLQDISLQQDLATRIKKITFVPPLFPPFLCTEEDYRRRLQTNLREHFEFSMRSSTLSRDQIQCLVKFLTRKYFPPHDCSSLKDGYEQFLSRAVAQNRLLSTGAFVDMCVPCLRRMPRLDDIEFRRSSTLVANGFIDLRRYMDELWGQNARLPWIYGNYIKGSPFK